ncbi:MAG: RNA-binding domain-containing protein [Bacteroidia bacterium]
MSLHINIQDLLSAKTVESDRIEFKEGWNPDAIYRSICAFANDFDNTGGGYILIGVEEKDGVAKRPVKGLTPSQIAEIQKKMIGFNNLINPAYHPRLFLETIDKKQIIILWIPGGSNRPYEVPELVTATNKRNFYYIRKYANSVKANTEEKQELISLANQVPFDDRANTQASVNDISMVLVQDHLRKTGSKLAGEVGKRPNNEILQQMELISGPIEHLFPRNVALMMFAENPEKFFPCTHVEVVHFPKGAEDPKFKEFPKITGTIPTQIEKTLQLLKTNFLKEQVIKTKGKAKSERIWNYPYGALEEAIANALYHRDYQVREPVEIRVYPNSIVILNYGGPDRSIKMASFNSGIIRPRRYRNRRLGDFLKELKLTEGKATGIPAILKALKDNGSPAPHFDTDADRSFFELELFKHPATASITDGKEAANKKDAAGVKQLSARLGASLSTRLSTSLSTRLSTQITETIKVLLMVEKEPLKREEIMTGIGKLNNTKSVRKYMEPLEEIGWISKTIPDKPNSQLQRYTLTNKGKKLLEELKANK